MINMDIKVLCRKCLNTFMSQDNSHGLQKNILVDLYIGPIDDSF